MLTPDQLAAIDQHLRSHLHEKKWLQQEEFIAEITDHYVSAISENMSRGSSFDSALTSVYNSFGQRTGLKQLELTYWKFSAQEFRRKVVHHILDCFKFPFVVVTLPLISVFLFARMQFAWVFYSPFGSLPYSFFHYSLYYTAAVSLLATLLKQYALYIGNFRPFVQRITIPMRRLSSGLLVLFCLEMFSSPILIGNISPYIATLLYTITALVYLGYNKAMKSYQFTHHIGQ